MGQSTAQRFEKVKAIYARELAQQLVATSRDDIPVSYELISDEWLTNTLCDNVADAKVIAHTLDTPDEGT